MTFDLQFKSHIPPQTARDEHNKYEDYVHHRQTLHSKVQQCYAEFVDIERRLYMHLVLVKFSQSVLSDFWKGITYETSRSINQSNKKTTARLFAKMRVRFV